MPQVTRRQAIQLFSAVAVAGADGAFAIYHGHRAEGLASLGEFPYPAVTLRDPGMLAQRGNVTDILLGLPEDGLMRPFRAMAGQTPSGMSLGGWYEWKPDYNPHTMMTQAWLPRQRSASGPSSTRWPVVKTCWPTSRPTAM